MLAIEKELGDNAKMQTSLGDQMSSSMSITWRLMAPVQRSEYKHDYPRILRNSDRRCLPWLAHACSIEKPSPRTHRIDQSVALLFLAFLDPETHSLDSGNPYSLPCQNSHAMKVLILGGKPLKVSPRRFASGSLAPANNIFVGHHAGEQHRRGQSTHR
jgi:hypothetical protein